MDGVSDFLTTFFEYKCSGFIDFIRLERTADDEPITVVKLSTKDIEHFTNDMSLRPVLLDMLFRQTKINLLTSQCYKGEHHFSAFLIEDELEQ